MISRWACVLPLLLAGCDDGTRAAGEAEHALVRGTVMRATNWEPVEGARVVGPRGVRARTGPEGRFELRGLRPGDAGAIRAEADGGWTASVPLRPLGNDDLEVVLHLSQDG